MTVSGDFIPDEELQEAGPEYPSVFGIQFTPTILGALVFVLGLGLAVFLYIRLVQPLLAEKQALDASIRDKQTQLTNSADAQAEAAAVEAELQAVVAERRQVYDLFASEEELKTLIFDINQQVVPTNVGTAALRTQLIEAGINPGLIEAQIISVEPNSGDSGIFIAQEGVNSDAPPYPAELSGQLRRQLYDITLQGDFSQTLSIIRNIERLEPLLVVRDVTMESSDVSDELDDLELGVPVPNILETSLQVEALLPTKSPDELPEVAPPEGEGAEGEAGEAGAEAPAS